MKSHIKFFIALLFLSNSIAGQDQDQEYPFYLSSKQVIWVDSIMANMSIEQMIGQLFAVDAFSDGNPSNEKRIENLIAKYKIGTVIFFKGEPIKQASLTNKFQQLSEIPLMIAMDAEWGVSMRLSNSPRLPMQMSVAATNRIENAYLLSEEIARECKRLGVHMSYSPVSDVNINPKNPIIGRRSFGQSRELVRDMAVASVKAYSDNRVLSCAKHFPGHGDTSQDSHLTLPLVDANFARIDSVELFPFKALIQEGVPAIMVAHLRIPALEKDKRLPSSLSSRVIDSLLVQELNFNGLIMSDALNMQGAQSFGSNVEINIQAFKAGNDILLYPLEIEKTVEEFKRQINSGKISIERLENSVRKILFAKFYVGLNKYKPVELNNLIDDLNSSQSESVIHKISRESITLIKNKNNCLPIIDSQKKIAHLYFGMDDFAKFSEQLSIYGNVQTIKADDLSVKQLRKRLNDFDVIVVSFDHPYYNQLKDKSKYNKSISKLRSTLKEITSASKKIIFNLNGDPYHLLKFENEMKNFDAVLLSYKNSEITQLYSAAVIFGAESPVGKLPVELGSKFPVGFGLSFPTLGRLSYSTPELEGFDPVILSGVDSMVNKTIEDSIIPGAQLLIARNGRIVYQKSFGFKTYDKKEAITNDMLYDIASVTKIAAATPIIMKLVENKKLNIDTPIVNYLPELDTSAKRDITLRKMLAHYAKLKPWIPFYQQTLSDAQPDFSKYYSKKYDKSHQIRVADNLFLRNDIRDSMYFQVLTSPLRDTLEYKYSDLPYYIVQKIIEDKFKLSPLHLLNQWFYEPLGLKHLGYLPLRRFEKNRIVPSEVDDYYRHQTILGDVNDPGTAMLGGVGMHAGLFSNSYDLAVLMQMYLQHGYYGGKIYLDSKILDEFTSCQFCDKGNRRGIGFDKPQLVEIGPTCGCVSYLSFGHHGFTGTMVWADPDKNIVYIFLSNRTYPDKDNNKLIDLNIRTEIQRIIYNAVKDEN